MRHQAFVHALAESGTNQPNWNALCAGFLVLRHFDDWLTVGSAYSREDLDAIALVREQIQAVPESDNEVRSLLGIAVDMLAQAEPTDVIGAVGPLLAYGCYLEQSGQQQLGYHVLSTITEVIDSPLVSDDWQSVISIYLQYGRAALRVGDYDDAEKQYARALAIAEQIGDDELALYAKVYIGVVWGVRGKVHELETLLDGVISAARQHRLTAVEARALHLRGNAFLQGARPDLALADLSASHAITTNPFMEELILADLACCTAYLGLWDASATMYEKLAKTARGKIARGIALINLLETAVMRNDRVKYEALWQDIREQYMGLLPVNLTMHAEYHAARGIEKFYNTGDAVLAYQNIMRKAAALGTLDVINLVKERLDSLLGKQTQS